MGLLDLISPALTVATNAAGTYQNAQAQGNQEKIQGVIQAIQLARQQRQAEIENIKNLAEANKNNAEAGTFTPEYAGQRAAAIRGAEQPFDIAKANLDLQNHLTELRQSGANDMQVAIARIQGEQAIANAQIQAAAARQSNQQGFTATQNDLNRKAAATRTGTQVQGHIQSIQQTQSGQVLPTIESLFGRGPLSKSTAVPSSSNQSTSTPSTNGAFDDLPNLTTP